MKKSLFVVAIIAAVMGVPMIASALDVVEPVGKGWEYTLGVGYKHFIKDAVGDAAYVGFRAQKRVQYPFLVGAGVEATAVGDVLAVDATIPVSIRLGVHESVKFDALIAPGVAYAKNMDTKVKKIMAVGMGGFEIKTFLKKGFSLGAGLYFTGYSKSEFNNIKAGLIIGF